MTDEQKKKPTAGFWIAVALLVALVAYPISFGPACWITSRADRGQNLLPVMYWPILKLLCCNEVHDLAARHPQNGEREKGVDGFSLKRGPLWWYAEVGPSEGAHWFYSVGYEKIPGEAVHIKSEEWEWR
jgi:hypothetical protein